MNKLSATPIASQVPPTLAGKRVLIADDCHAQQHILSHWLTRAAMTVTLACNGREVVEYAAREPFDAILLDMQMPQVDGYEAAKQLRQQGYRGPILALTATTFSGDEQRCLEAGCDGFLAKPVQAAELLGALMCRLAENASSQQLSPSPRESPKDLLRLYVNGLNQRMREVQEALAAQDRMLVARLAHKTRGSAAMYGFVDLAEAAQLLEDAARDGQDAESLRKLIGEMDAIVQRIGKR